MDSFAVTSAPLVDTGSAKISCRRAHALAFGFLVLWVEAVVVLLPAVEVTSAEEVAEAFVVFEGLATTCPGWRVEANNGDLPLAASA
jgi:hypothetical protein